LTNKTALVTGGGSGIGESICRVFAGAGARVFLLDINEENARRVAGEIQAGGGKAEAVAGDVSRQEEMIRICEDIVKKAGRLDILVNNAGIAHVGTLESTTEEDLDRIYSVNIKGVYNGMLAAIPHMKRQNGGVILNMGSIASSLGLPGRFAYSMSKGAVLTMTYTVARDYIDYNIRCNSIAPARVHTPFVDGFLAKNYPGKEAEMFENLSKTQPIGRMGKPEEIAHLALYLCSDEASFITGTNYPIDGGFLTLNT
ncbi:MAG: SDR family oxidoreductase, partial [Phaeodactylibacter sp.]|nr:SDR family oxidoreductase [Phaeodactylibacter sp.]